jgi:hypothetical protein
VGRLRLYVDAGSTTNLVRAAVYSDEAGAPGALLAQGSGLPVPGWNSIALSPASVVAGARYWVAVLSPLGSGTLALREAQSGGSSQLSQQSTLAAFPRVWSAGLAGASAPVSAYVQQVPPSVTVIGPADGETVSDGVSLNAVVDDDVAVSVVQFLVDGVPVGPALSARPFTWTWDSHTAAGNVNHVIAARAVDALGRASVSAGVSVAVDNGPVISRVVTSPGLTASSMRVGWSTDVLGDSQVEYGPTVAYGLSTPLEPGLAWTHEQQVTGLVPGTTYHFRVRSRDAAGVLAVSPDFTFTTP